MTALMNVATTETGVSVEQADKTKVMDNIDTLARRFLGISGPAFLKGLRAGAYDDAADSPRLNRLVSAAALLG